MRRYLGVVAVAVPALFAGVSSAPRQAPVPPVQPAPACVARCQTSRAEKVATAAKTRDAGGYYVGMMSHNCPTPWPPPKSGENTCVAAVNACKDSWEACHRALNACCYPNAVAWADHQMEQCIQECPVVPAVAPPPPDEPKVQRDTRAGDAAARSAGTASADRGKMTAADYDNLRRNIAFDQVRTEMTTISAAFAVVSGGEGRLWVLRPDKTQVQVPADLAKLLRQNGNYSQDVAAGLFQDLQNPAKMKPPFTWTEAEAVISSITLASLSAELKAGQVLYFPPGGGWAGKVVRDKRASSEHSSIRGTINGGGDFI